MYYSIMLFIIVMPFCCIVEGVGLDRVTGNFDRALIDSSERVDDQEVRAEGGGVYVCISGFVMYCILHTTIVYYIAYMLLVILKHILFSYLSCSMYRRLTWLTG